MFLYDLQLLKLSTIKSIELGCFYRDQERQDMPNILKIL
jgi:hypothetical protein